MIRKICRQSYELVTWHKLLYTAKYDRLALCSGLHRHANTAKIIIISFVFHTPIPLLAQSSQNLRTISRRKTMANNEIAMICYRSTNIVFPNNASFMEPNLFDMGQYDWKLRNSVNAAHVTTAHLSDRLIYSTVLWNCTPVWKRVLYGNTF